MKMRMMVVSGLGLMVCGMAGAQAPAGAPAGANGICKDGTYSMAAVKSGACGGHKGVQTWYAAAPAKAAASGAASKASGAAMPAPAPAASVAARPAPSPAAAVASRPAPSPAAPAAAPAAAAGGAAKKGQAGAAAGKTQAPGGGPGLVWVNTDSNVYHCNGDTYYGKTKAGAYMSEADAKAKGARGDHGKSCGGK